jgi:hypothetical protein
VLNQITNRVRIKAAVLVGGRAGRSGKQQSEIYSCRLCRGFRCWQFRVLMRLPCFRATIQAIAAYLDVFQKIADAATSTRGEYT